MAKILDRDKKKRKISLLPVKFNGEHEPSVAKLDVYAKRIAKAEKLNVNLLIALVIVIACNIGLLLWR